MAERDLERIRRFLSLAKLLASKEPALEQEFEGFYVAYDGYWTRYRTADYSVRCRVPEDISSTTELPECARNCWKLLMFRRKQKMLKHLLNFFFLF